MVAQNQTDLDFALNLDFKEILTNPILDIAARFWEDDRYEAFKICYRSMRIIDDLVDDRKAAGGPMTTTERERYLRMLDNEVNSLKRKRPSHAFQSELIATMERFRIPFWPWEKLATAMIYDLTHDGYPTFRIFLRYCEGAAVAPASVFMHLCGVTVKKGGYVEPVFDSRKASRALAIFSYLVHIIRDYERDWKNNLNYFAHDLLVHHGLNLPRFQGSNPPEGISPSFRNLIAYYQRLAEYYRRQARAAIDRIRPYLKARYQLSLEIIYNLYLQIFERINPQSGSLTTSELSPEPHEIQGRIDDTINAFQPASQDI